MKKPDLLTLLILAVPLLAMIIAGTPDSVAVFELTAEGLASGEPVYCSYFTLIEDVSTGVCLPFAGVLGSVGFGLAVLYMVTGKEMMLKGVFGCCFGAMTLAVIPVMVQVDAFLLPNAVVPLLLGINCILAYAKMKKPQVKEETEKGKRLKNR